jgi:hypothetical protein
MTKPLHASVPEITISQPKKLLGAVFIGAEGATLAKLLALKMGCTWHDTDSQTEVGVDAWMELGDPGTGEMLGQWLAVQSKAHEGDFRGEDDDSFAFDLPRRDVAYWVRMNTHVIVVVSRPSRLEAWWQPITDELREGTDRVIRLRFDKRQDRFGPQAYEALHALSARRVPLASETLTPTVPVEQTASGTVFPFRSVGGGQLVPAIEMRVRRRDGPYSPPLLGILDSGADHSVLPLPFAEHLGVSPSHCEMMVAQTAGGTAKVFRWPEGLLADICGKEIAIAAEFGPVEIPLLGRADFFASFVVTIDSHAQTFRLASRGNNAIAQRD